MNPLIVRSLLLNKCNRQQITAKYQKDASSLFFRSPVPTNQMALQWTVTCFSFGGKCTPGIPISPSTPTTSNSTLYMHFISVRWIPGRKLLSHPQVKRVKTFLIFLRPSAALRVSHSGHLVLVVRICSFFDGGGLFLWEQRKWSALPPTLNTICQKVFSPLTKR